MHTMEELFGTSSADVARDTIGDPMVFGVGNAGPVATTDVRDEPPMSALRALTDPHGSAIFWLAAAALLGLVMVTGQFRIQAALGAGGRAGRR